MTSTKPGGAAEPLPEDYFDAVLVIWDDGPEPELVQVADFHLGDYDFSGRF